MGLMNTGLIGFGKQSVPEFRFIPNQLEQADKRRVNEKLCSISKCFCVLSGETVLVKLLKADKGEWYKTPKLGEKTMKVIDFPK